MLINLIYLVILIHLINVCDSKTYSNYTLYRVTPVSESNVEFLSKLNEFYDVNFWLEPGVVKEAIDFVINPEDRPAFLRDAEEHNIYLTTLIEDVQKAFDQQTVKSYIRRDMKSFDWNTFYRLDDIYNWLRDLAKMYSEEFQILTIGRSHENREILAVKIVLKGSQSPRSTVIVEGGIHAREWIAPSFVTYLIYQILHADSSINKLLREETNRYDWYFVPVLNVDGYEYTHTTDRLWRKNRRGHGVDLNRNFPYAFGTVGISSNKKDETYCGPKALSEKETLAMSEFVKSKSNSLKYYIAFHSYGQYMILPYSNSKEHLDNYDEVYKMCTNISRRIASRYGTKYTIGTAFDTVQYLSSGVSACWVKSAFKVPYVITFELRDDGHYGFALPPSMILPTCKETMDGLIELFFPGKSLATDRRSYISYQIIFITNFISLILHCL